MERLGQREQIFLWGLFGVALTLRLGYLTVFVGLGSPPTYDGIGYDQLATSLLHGQGYRNHLGLLTAFRPPVYPVFLAGVYLLTNHSFAAVRVLQAVLDSFTVMLVFLIARELANKRVAVLAAIGGTIYPLLIFETGEIYPETLSFFLQFAAVWCLVRMLRIDHWALPLAAGLLMGLTVLARPTATLWIPLILLWLLLPNLFHHSFQKLAMVMLGLLLVFGPWTLRNYVVLGGFVPISSLSGAAIWGANNSLSDGGNMEPTPTTWGASDYPTYGWYGWEGLSELESNKRFTDKGFAWIRDNPFQFVMLVPKKLLRLWSPVSYGVQFGRQAPSWLAPLVVPPYLVFLAIAVYGIYLYRAHWRRVAPLLAIILSINLLVIPTYGATRYAIPMMVCLLFFAAMALDYWMRRNSTTGEPFSMKQVA